MHEVLQQEYTKYEFLWKGEGKKEKGKNEEAGKETFFKLSLQQMRKGIVMERRRGLELGRVVAHQHSHSPQPHCSQTQTGVKTVHGADTGGAAAGIGSGAVVVAERAIPQM